MMDYEVCLRLKDLGMKLEDVDDIPKYDVDAYDVDIKQCDFVVDFLRKKDLSEKEICNLLKENPYMISVEKGRCLVIDDILNGLGFLKKDKKILINSNNYIYTASPTEMDSIIKYMKSIGYNKEEIRNKFLDDTDLITDTLEDAKIKILRK